jgi:major membrane immunogen (membrane-anchored lipoprotein)
MEMFNPPEPEDNIPRLQIFKCSDDEHDGHPNCCPVMINSILACSYDKKSKDGKAVEDVAEFEGDDPYDDLRYAVDTAENYFKEAVDEFKKIQMQAELLARVNATQDWTAFYRQMRTVESTGSSETKMVRRYHNPRRR